MWSEKSTSSCVCVRALPCPRPVQAPDGIYGAWGTRGLIAYVVGFVASIPLFVIPGVYTGVLAARLGGVDFGWLVSGIAAAVTFVLLSRQFDSKAEDQAVADSARALVSQNLEAKSQ